MLCDRRVLLQRVQHGKVITKERRIIMLNEQLLAKAKTANSAEELLSMAKEEGIPLTEAEATAYFQQLNAVEGELADEELDNVSGGSDSACGGGTRTWVDATDTCRSYTGTGDGFCRSCSHVEKEKKYKETSYTYYCTIGMYPER
jgi:predicted ribosomally synthesized peptide with nif11-like leader